MIICNNVYIGLTILYKAIIGDVIYLGYNVFILYYSHGNHNERVFYVEVLVFKRKLFSKDLIIIGKIFGKIIVFYGMVQLKIML